jgi:hypothetical protein
MILQALFFLPLLLSLPLSEAWPAHEMKRRMAGSMDGLLLQGPPNATDFANRIERDNSKMAPCPFLNSAWRHGFITGEEMTIEAVRSFLSFMQIDGVTVTIMSGSNTEKLMHDTPNGKRLDLKDTRKQG